MQQVVPELPVVDVPQNARQGRVARVVDRRPGAVLQQVPDNVQHVPLVPRLVVILVAVATLLQGVADYQDVQRGVAERVGLVDELAQSVLHQQFGRLQGVLGRLLALQQDNVKGRHQLRRRPHRRFGAALDQQLQELDVQQGGVVNRVELVVALPEKDKLHLTKSYENPRTFLAQLKLQTKDPI